MASPVAKIDRGSMRTRWGRLGAASDRRTSHMWIPAEEQGQPQDGASRFDGDSDQPQMPHTPEIVSSPRDLHEPEDARLTGGTRSLMRRVLGLNVTAPATKPLRALPSLYRIPA